MGSGKKGGSQLAQLRSGLRDAGITGPKPKKGKRDQDDSRIGQYRAQQRRKRLDALMSNLNAFDERTSHNKNELPGSKVKGSLSRPAQSKSASLKQRREKLLPEYQARHRSSTFVDRRFGEYNPTMSMEDKMLKRFTQERMNRSNKSSMFDLNDDDGELTLTHYGQSLSGLDELPDVDREDNEDEENPRGQIDATETEMQHFSGFDEGNDDAPRSKNEVMKEIIAKSKLAKYERQKQKDADEEMRMELDEELGDIRSLLFTQPADTPTQEEAKPAESKGDEYDAFVREMAFERRARPQDRLKTTEELVEEQAKRLREAEERRQRRMRGEQDDEGDEMLDYALESDDEEPSVKRFVKAEETRSQRSRFGLGEGLAAKSQTTADQEEEEEDEEDDEEEDDEDEDEDEDEEDDDDEVDESMSNAAQALADYQHMEQFGEHTDTQDTDALTESSQRRHLSKADRESVPTLPYTFPCPSTHDAFLDLLEEHNVQPLQLHTVISRIRVLHAPNLSEENPVKLQRFLNVIVDHLLYRTIQDDVHEDDLRILNDMLLHISELAKTYPLQAAEHFVAKLSIMQRNLMRGLSQGALDPGSKTWPRLSELTFLRMSGLLWPTSDRWHAVAAPMSLLMAQYLAHARIRSCQDIASALYLCSLVSSAQKESKRLVPEALNILFSVAAILLPLHHGKPQRGNSAVKALAEEFGIPTPDVEAVHTSHLTITSDAASSPKMKLTAVFPQASDTPTLRADLLRMCVSLQCAFARLYRASPGFVEMFTPMVFLLEIGLAGLRDVASSLVPHVQEAATELRSMLEASYGERRALRLQAHRALSITSYAPKFEQQAFDPKRATDPDTERAYASKMRALVKKERKGAIRELRKDAQFIAEEREQRRVEEDAAYKKKIDKIVGGIQEERSEQKQLERAKSVLKKRAGKR
ncbi:nucleolar complex protein 14 [Malassezia equina]|uniref:Nucleolar complex protein 14 n=1 Tax=Malassezia equina TaxID=1381935 RepID=A0AAF0EDF9_9BASI|nr:nucleolar complex protein 14 [Malassezia equina]